MFSSFVLRYVTFHASEKMAQRRIGNDLYKSELLLILRKKYKCDVRLSDWACATKTDVYQAFRLIGEEYGAIVAYDRVAVLNTKTCIVNSYKSKKNIYDSFEPRSDSFSSIVSVSVDHSTREFVGIFLEQFFLIENFSWFFRNFDNKCVTTVQVDELGYWLSQKNIIIRFWHFEPRNSFLGFLQKRILRTVQCNLLKICNLPPSTSSSNSASRIRTENSVIRPNDNSTNDSIPRVVRVMAVGKEKRHLLEQVTLDDTFSVHLIDTHACHNSRSILIGLLQDFDLLKRYLSNERVLTVYKGIVSTIDEPSVISPGDRTLSRIHYFPMISTIIFFSKIAIVNMFDRLDFATNVLETICKTMDVSIRDDAVTTTNSVPSGFDCSTDIHEILRYTRARFAARRRFSLLCEIASSRFSQLRDNEMSNNDQTLDALSTERVVERHGKKRKKSDSRISY